MKALKTKILWQIHFWVSGSGLFGGLGSREHCGLCLATIWFWSDQYNFAIWPYGQNSRLGRKWKYCKIQNIGVGISFKCVAAVLISWRMIAAAKTHLLLLFMLFLLYVEHPTIISYTLYAFLDALQSPQISIPPLIVLRSISYLDKCVIIQIDNLSRRLSCIVDQTQLALFDWLFIFCRGCSLFCRCTAASVSTITLAPNFSQRHSNQKFTPVPSTKMSKLVCPLTKVNSLSDGRLYFMQS